MKVQLKAESIDEYVDGFRQIAGRLKRPPSTSSQIDIVYKNLRREYRDYFRGHAINSFKQLLKLGRELEKENSIDERQSILMGKRTERLAEVTEKKESERAGENKSGKKGVRRKIARIWKLQQWQPKIKRSSTANYHMDSPALEVLLNNLLYAQLQDLTLLFLPQGRDSSKVMTIAEHKGSWRSEE